MRLLGCSGAMRFNMLLDDFAYGEYAVGRGDDANGEPGLELTRRMSSDMGVDFLEEMV